MFLTLLHLGLRFPTQYKESAPSTSGVTQSRVKKRFNDVLEGLRLAHSRMDSNSIVAMIDFFVDSINCENGEFESSV